MIDLIILGFFGNRALLKQKRQKDRKIAQTEKAKAKQPAKKMTEITKRAEL